MTRGEPRNVQNALSFLFLFLKLKRKNSTTKDIFIIYKRSQLNTKPSKLVDLLIVSSFYDYCLIYNSLNLTKHLIVRLTNRFKASI